MTAHQFYDFAGRLQKGPWLWVFLAIFVAVFFISIGLFVEDFTTSLMGYELWPTRKANDWVLWLVAFLPQIGQVAFAYAWIDTRDPKYAVFMFLTFFWDISTDVYFKSYQFQSPQLTAMATFESVVLFTIGSEFLMAFSLGMIYAVWGYLKQQNFSMSTSYIRKQDIPAPPPPPDFPRIKYNRPSKKG